MTKTMTTATDFRVRAIPEPDLRFFRETGHDRLGNPVEVHVNEEEGGAPLRCCLTEASPGERIALVAYRPFSSDGPYAEVGPVYVHADPCEGYLESDRYPRAFRPRRQVLRAYGYDGRICDAHLVEGVHAEAAMATLFSDPQVAFIHSRNVLYGCYMFRIDRAPLPAS